MKVGGRQASFPSQNLPSSLELRIAGIAVHPYAWKRLQADSSMLKPGSALHRQRHVSTKCIVYVLKSASDPRPLLLHRASCLSHCPHARDAIHRQNAKPGSRLSEERSARYYKTGHPNVCESSAPATTSRGHPHAAGRIQVTELRQASNDSRPASPESGCSGSQSSSRARLPCSIRRDLASPCPESVRLRF